MAIAIPSITRVIPLPVKNGGDVYIPPDVTPMPTYVPATAPIPPNPVIAPPPDGQFKGVGGTSFYLYSGIARPPIVLQPYIIPMPPKEPLYDLPANDAYAPMAPAVPMIVPKAPTGSKANVLPPPIMGVWTNSMTGQTKVGPNDAPPNNMAGWTWRATAKDVPAVVTSVPSPGFLKGNVAGFDLSRVPSWAWLVAGALVLSKVLR